MESLHSSVDKENMQLRKDKVLLVDHVSELQRKVRRGPYRLTLSHVTLIIMSKES